MRRWKITLAPATAAMVVTLLVGVYAQQSPAGKSKPAAKSVASEVQHIELPQYPPEIPKGPNVETYRQNCLICHTARYVSMQPRFSKKVWQSEVKKMVDVYGAPISEADQTLIVEYLVTVKGAEAESSAPAISK